VKDQQHVVILVNYEDPTRAVEELATYIESGKLGETMNLQPLEEFLAAGRIEGCTCGMLSCICALVLAHPDESCKFRKSVTCAVGIECEHGFDVCPKCDPCTCPTRSEP